MQSTAKTDLSEWGGASFMFVDTNAGFVIVCISVVMIPPTIWKPLLALDTVQ